MAVTVKIPTQLRSAAGGESEAVLEGATARAARSSLRSTPLDVARSSSS
jgi:molybdopterin converting factor small subunit